MTVLDTSFRGNGDVIVIRFALGLSSSRHWGATVQKPFLAMLIVALSAGLGIPNRALSADATSGPARPQARIVDGPGLERATDSWAIIRWTTTNVKGTSLRYGVVHYGTDPHDLGMTAKSPNRWNPGLPTMIYRVQVNHLQSATTYYYRAASTNALGAVEGPESAVGHFATEKVP